MNICQTCRWWEDAEEGEFAGSYPIFKVCTNPKLNLVYQAQVGSRDGAGASASDEDGLGFWTGPEFGCIHHEAR